MNETKIKAGESHNTELSNKDRNRIIKKGSRILEQYFDLLGFDYANDMNMKGTAERIVKSHLDDLFLGCFSKEPDLTAFPNVDENKYDGMVFQGDITLNSMCSHHWLNFLGKVHVAYIPDGHVIGLSKLNRIVEWFARRPQIQENLTMQIHNYINKVCEGNKGVAVVIEANHLCACVRGVKHNSTMKTAKLSGAFLETDRVREEFYSFIGDLK